MALRNTRYWTTETARQAARLSRASAAENKTTRGRACNRKRGYQPISEWARASLARSSRYAAASLPPEVKQ